MVYKKIIDNLYNVSLLFFSGCPIEVAQKKAKRVFNIQEEISIEPREEAALFVCTTRENARVYIIWVKKSRDIATIAHEVAHLIFFIFKDKGIPNNFQNQEAFAYYTSYWIEHILKRKK